MGSVSLGSLLSPRHSDAVQVPRWHLLKPIKTLLVIAMLSLHFRLLLRNDGLGCADRQVQTRILLRRWRQKSLTSRYFLRRRRILPRRVNCSHKMLCRFLPTKQVPERVSGLPQGLLLRRRHCYASKMRCWSLLRRGYQNEQWNAV